MTTYTYTCWRKKKGKADENVRVYVDERERERGNALTRESPPALSASSVDDLASASPSSTARNGEDALSTAGFCALRNAVAREKAVRALAFQRRWLIGALDRKNAGSDAFVLLLQVLQRVRKYE